VKSIYITSVATKVNTQTVIIGVIYPMNNIQMINISNHIQSIPHTIDIDTSGRALQGGDQIDIQVRVFIGSLYIYQLISPGVPDTTVEGCSISD
jgi:hypothetical protein